MKPLENLSVVALDTAADGALARLLESFGARIERTALATLPAKLSHATFLSENLGLRALHRAGISRAWIEQQHPRLIHVSMTGLGSVGTRAVWAGGELVGCA